ncbi:hypothetical protein ACFSL6_00010 [Paenibacillus thailandensis]|uniref:rhamnogalacturonan endolyase family protein n=1 Tax=Paenibacillus thailandensis TaxID=393250 RepID=UPI00362B9550
MEQLDRAPVSGVKDGAGRLYRRRCFWTRPDSISFNVYRDGKKMNSRPVLKAARIT